MLAIPRRQCRAVAEMKERGDPIAKKMKSRTTSRTVPRRDGERNQISRTFHEPTPVGRELEYMADAIAQRHLSGNGRFTGLCHGLIEDWLGGGRALLTPSGTAALEMAAILLDIAPGDEIIMPSWTFPSTTNAFVLRGAVPVFVDIRPDTLNLDESLIENAITPRTRAICVVHYAGVGADVEAIADIATRHGLSVVEDAALAIFARRNGRSLGSFGQLAAFSFHHTKPLTSGEGGALIVNDPGMVARAEVVWEKGTDRVRFKRGEVSRYSWIDVGSSYVQSEIWPRSCMPSCSRESRVSLRGSGCGTVIMVPLRISSGTASLPGPPARTLSTTAASSICWRPKRHAGLPSCNTFANRASAPRRTICRFTVPRPVAASGGLEAP